ncbi:MAG: antibiotic biosynthesis monooxygenase family protein [bacterium]
MLRHTALFLHRDTISEDQKLAMRRGLAFLRMECAGVRAGDYGEDLFGGSSPLLAVPPWKRTPRWRARREGPPCNYDVALHLDFDDEAALARYRDDEHHQAVARRNAAVNVPDLTARIDWRYEGAPLVRRGFVRHTAMFVWAGEADAAARSRALASARNLAGVPGVVSAAIGENAGGPANFDWILDLQLPDPAAARGLVEGPRYAEAMDIIAPAIKHEWTARVTHVMRGD